MKMKTHITTDDMILILKIGFIIVLTIAIFGFIIKGCESVKPCTFSLRETTPVGYSGYGMQMSDGSHWNSYTGGMEINHTYVYAKCDMYDGSCVCPKGTAGPYITKEVKK